VSAKARNQIEIQVKKELTTRMMILTMMTMMTMMTMRMMMMIIMIM
jgi:hypothetical protein